VNLGAYDTAKPPAFRRIAVLLSVPARFGACMATCPRCRGHLTDSHRCPRRPTVVAAEITLAALAGGLVALLGVALVDPHGQFTHIDTAVVTIGLFAGIGLDRLIRG
jgi:uncharacterized paraquat-inducible protein A